MLLPLFICLYSAFIGWAAVFFPFLYLSLNGKKQQLFREICCSLVEKSNFEEVAAKKLQNDVFDAEVEELIDRKLDDLVLVFKKQIPMASTFLTGNLVVKLKSSAKAEIVKMIPEIKAKLLLRMKRDLKPSRLIEEQADRINFNLIDRYCYRYALIGGAVGFLFGLLQLAILPLFVYTFGIQGGL